LGRSALILSAAVSEHHVDESSLYEDEDNRSEEKEAIPQEIDLAPEIRVGSESGVGMSFVAGDSRDGDCGYQSVGCKPPEAVRTFHAKEILFSSC
jgi:hypothetical protein